MNLIPLKRFLIFCIIIGQILFQGVTVPLLSTPIYLLCLIFLALIEIVEWAFKSNFKIRRNQNIAIILLLSVINIIFVYFLNGFFPIDRFLLIVCCCLFCEGCYDVSKNAADRNLIINIFIFVAFISSLVELGQFFGIGFCYTLWNNIQHSGRIEAAKASERFIGLSPTILHFAYVVSAAIILTIFRKFNKYNVVKKLVLLSVFFVALMTNNTRSSVIAVALSIFVWMLVDYRKNKNYIYLRFFLVALLSIAILFGSTRIDLIYNSRLGMNEGYDVRVSMLLTGLNHIIHYPFGMGVYNVQSELIVSMGKASRIYIQVVGAHNIFCNVGASYGIIGLLLIIMLYFNLFKVYKNNKNRSNEVIGVFWGIVGLFVNSNFHNLYIFNGEIISFILIAILLSYQNSNKELGENR